MKTLICAMLAVTAAPGPAHAATFAFTETFGIGRDAATGSGAPVVATGTFDGDVAGNVITNLRNVSVFLDGTAFAGNGALFAGRFDRDLAQFVAGGATASLDGSANDFFFSDALLGTAVAPRNYYYANGIDGLSGAVSGVTDDGITGLFGASTALSPGTPLTITRVEASPSVQPGAVPEPASWALMLLGFGTVGYAMRRRATVRVAQAV